MKNKIKKRFNYKLNSFFEPLLSIYLIKLLGWFDFSITLLSYCLLLGLLVSRYLKFIIPGTFLLVEKKFLEYIVTSFFIFTLAIIINYLAHDIIFTSTIQKQYYFFFLTIMLFSSPSFIQPASNHFNAVCNSAFFFTVIATIYGIIFLLESLTNYIDFGFTQHLINRGYDYYDVIYSGRACGFFINPGMHSYIVFSFIPVILALKKFELITFVKFNILLFLLTFSIMITISKTTIPFLLLYLFYFLASKSSFKNIAGLICSIIVLVLLSIVSYYAFKELDFGHAYSIKKLLTFFQNPIGASTFTVRIEGYSEAMNIISDNFLVGAGLGASAMLLNITIHNTILELFSSLGLLGFFYVLFVSFIIPLKIISMFNVSYIKRLSVGYFLFHLLFLISRDLSHFDSFIIFYYILYQLYYLDRYLSPKASRNDCYRLSI